MRTKLFIEKVIVANVMSDYEILRMRSECSWIVVNPTHVKPSNYFQKFKGLRTFLEPNKGNVIKYSAVVTFFHRSFT